MEKDLINMIRPMIIRCWNLNNSELCIDVNVSVVYLPDVYDGENIPIIRYTLHMLTGRKQEEKNCSVPFTEMINSFVKNSYESLLDVS
jgi:hypothetical protein